MWRAAQVMDLPESAMQPGHSSCPADGSGSSDQRCGSEMTWRITIANLEIPTRDYLFPFSSRIHKKMCLVLTVSRLMLIPYSFSFHNCFEKKMFCHAGFCRWTGGRKFEIFLCCNMLWPLVLSAYQ